MPQAAKAAKAQAESETLAKAKSMVGCHGADNEFAAIKFPNARRVLVIGSNQISNGICCSQNLRPQLKHQPQMVKQMVKWQLQLPQLHWMSSQGQTRPWHQLGTSNMMGFLWVGSNLERLCYRVELPSVSFSHKNGQVGILPAAGSGRAPWCSMNLKATCVGDDDKAAMVPNKMNARTPCHPKALWKKGTPFTQIFAKPFQYTAYISAYYRI